MIIYRAQTKQGQWIEGYYYRDAEGHYIKSWNHRFYTEETYNVLPISLACSIGYLDKNKKPIFGSVKLEEETNSKGGDIVQTFYDDGEKGHIGEVVYHWTGWLLKVDRKDEKPYQFPLCSYSGIFEIIGNSIDGILKE